MVSIIDDNALEGDHEFTVSIGMTVPPITIDNAPTEVIIEDNEGEFYEAEDKTFREDSCYFTWVMLKNFDSGVREGEEIHRNICNAIGFQCQDLNTVHQTTEINLSKIAMQSI